MARFRLRRGQRVPFAAAEETARNAEEAAAPVMVAAAMDAQAADAADTAIGRALLRLLWDQETRLRALGSQSVIVPVQAAADEAAYRGVVVAYIRGLL